MSDQGKEYAAFIAAELRAEEQRRESVTARAATALTGTASLITLGLAVFAVVLGKDFKLTGPAKAAIAFTLLAFLCAAFCAVMAGRAQNYSFVTSETIYSMVNERWTDSEVSARNIAAFSNAFVLDHLRPGTNVKTKWLQLSAVFQLVAILGLALCAAAVVFSTPTAAANTPEPVACTTPVCPCPTTAATPETDIPTVNGRG